MTQALPIPPLTPHVPAVKPLSYQQAGWLEAERGGFVGWKSATSCVVTNIYTCLRVTGKIDVSALHAAATAMVWRHSALRTAMRLQGDAPVAQVAQASQASRADVQVRYTDLRRLAHERRERELEHVVAEDLLLPFDLSGAQPLLRLTVGKVGPSEQVVAIIMPHVVSDGASLRISAQDLTTHYGVAVGAHESQRPTCQLDYGDFAVWQHRWLGAIVKREVCANYLENLRGAQPLMLNVGHRIANKGDSFDASQLTREIDAAHAARVRAVALRRRTVAFSVIVAAYLAAIGRFTDQESLAISVPMRGRRHPEVVRMIGFFTCIALVRVELTGKPTLRAFIERVAHAVEDATRFDGVPYGFLREVARSELLDLPALTVSANVVGTERHGESARVGDTEWAPCALGIPADVAVPRSRYDVSLLINYRRTGAIQLTLRYRDATLDANVVREIAADLATILEHADSVEELPVDELRRAAVAARRE